MKACYYAEITLVDEQFGRIIDHLETTGQIDNTLIVFHSDHGEMLGDHGLLYKGCRFFEGLVHVPLIVAGPGVQQDVRSNALVELVDIAPTVLEAAAIDIPYYMQGTSLMNLCSATGDAINLHKSHVFCEYHDAMAAGTVNTDGREFDASHGTMYFDGRYKLCVYHGHDLGELYDLETDPDEFDDLWNDPDHQPLKLKLFQRHIDAFAATTSAGIERVKAY
jgi:arylsulfatase A-like enzyme